MLQRGHFSARLKRSLRRLFFGWQQKFGLRHETWGVELIEPLKWGWKKGFVGIFCWKMLEFPMVSLRSPNEFWGFPNALKIRLILEVTGLVHVSYYPAIMSWAGQYVCPLQESTVTPRRMERMIIPGCQRFYLFGACENKKYHKLPHFSKIFNVSKVYPRLKTSHFDWHSKKYEESYS